MIPLHIQELGVSLYASVYSPQILKYLDFAQLIPKSKITFSLLFNLHELGFEHTKHIAQPTQYQKIGDTISFWPVGYELPLRAEFFGERLERIYTYEPATGRKVLNITELWLGESNGLNQADQNELKVVQNSEEKTHKAIFVTFIQDHAKKQKNLKIIEYDYAYPSLFWNRLDIFAGEVEKLEKNGHTIYLQTKHYNQIPGTVKKRISHPKETLPPNLPAGFTSFSQKVTLYTDREIFGTIYLTGQDSKYSNTSRLLRQFEGEISVGDFVVHTEYGIGIYAGLTQEIIDSQLREYLKISYDLEDELLLPVEQIDKLTKYIGQEGVEPKLSKLSKKSWENEKKKARKSITILARELIEHMARREIARAFPIPQGDSKDYQNFVDSFTFQETTDQIKAINEIITDLEKETPMNRLLIGDVGFGKTEVMMRTAFKMMEAGKQAALLCPTTILAAQHLAVFTKRFKNTEFKIASLSRFNTAKENRNLIDALNSGDIDLAIGTHRLLSRDVKFQNLGLLMVDEEQRFGVKQKERIKQVNYGVHHLSSSATPIPRTLSMALSTIQDISIISTPPSGRKPIITKLIRNDWNTLVQAVHREIDSGGQIYFVHNRVQSIPTIKAKLEKFLPGTRIVIAHGQMSSAELDKAMMNFYQHRYDILLCTTIIENGLDLPNVNTIIINQAHKFGLAQLYQLRGRVGRSSKQAHCYLFYEGKALEEDLTIVKQDIKKSPKEKTEERNYLRRLQGIVDASGLGAGFQIASRDLEIRGAGSLLGEKQHGHISQLGYALYMKLLATEVEKLKGLKDNLPVEYVSL